MLLVFAKVGFMNNQTTIQLGRKGAAGVAQISPEDYARLSNRVWSLDNSNGYVVCFEKNANGVKVKKYMHREVLGLEPGDGFIADHKNGDKLDNRLENLRVVTRGQNAQNRNKNRGISKYRGVTFNKRTGKWVGRVRGATSSWSATFTTEEEAAIITNSYRLFMLPYSNPDPEVVKLLKN